MKSLTTREKRLYWTMWSVVALVAAIYFSLRDKPVPKPAYALNVILDADLQERFAAVDVEKRGLDHVSADFHLKEAFLSTVVRFEKEMTVGYQLQRGSLELDKGEFRIVIQPLVSLAHARFPNRKKVDFDTVHPHLPGSISGGQPH